MIGRYEITDGGEAVGSLEVSRRGMMYRFTALCRKTESPQTVSRLYITCAQARANIGVLSPTGDGGWRLERSFSAQSLHQMGIERIDSCIVERETEEWLDEPEPERLFSDEELRRVCRDMYDTLSAVCGGETLLAVPVESRRPFPAMPIFCFGEPKRIGGRDYVVFTIRGGQLC